MHSFLRHTQQSRNRDERGVTQHPPTDLPQPRRNERKERRESKKKLTDLTKAAVGAGWKASVEDAK